MTEEEIIGLDRFFESTKEMPEILKSTSPELKLFSPSKNRRSWSRHVHRDHLILIFKWLNKENNEAYVRNLIASSPTRAAFIIHEESRLFLTIEIILRGKNTHIFFSTKSNRANPSGNERLKEPELSEEDIKAGRKKSKIIEHGSLKRVQYCYHWQPGMKDLHIYAVSILTGEMALASAQKEEKISQIIGSFYANPCMAGVLRIKKGDPIINLYSPLALGSQEKWIKGQGITPMITIPPVNFLFILFMQTSSLAWLHHLGIVLRDIKEKNYLVFSDSKWGLHTKMIDFSFAELMHGDEKFLRNCAGTASHCPPEHDFFSDLRKAKINQLLLDKEYLCFKKTIKFFKHNDETHSQFLKLIEEYKIVEQKRLKSQTQVLVAKALLLDEFPNACPQSIEIILNCTDAKKLCSPERNQLKFLANPKDDVWAFSVLMVNFVSEYLDRVAPSPVYGSLQIVQQYFKDNLKLFRASRPTANQIVGEFLGLFKIIYPNPHHEIHQWVKVFRNQERDFKVHLNPKKSVLKPVSTSIRASTYTPLTLSSPRVFASPGKISGKTSVVKVLSPEKENISQISNSGVLS